MVNLKYPERILFACCLSDNEVIAVAIKNGITRESFGWYKYRDIWDKILEINNAGQTLDFTSFGAVIEDQQLLKMMSEHMPYIINPRTDGLNAIILIKEKYYRERGKGIVVSSFQKLRADKPLPVLRELVEKIGTLIKIRADEKEGDIIGDIENDLNRKNIISTGYPKLNWMTKGIESSAMWVIGGSSSHGKTNLVLNIAYNVAQSYPVAVFSSEMSTRHLLKRMGSMYTGLNPSLKDLSEVEKIKFLEGVRMAQVLPLTFFKTVSLAEIKLEVQKCKAVLYIVDFLQMVRPDTNIENDVKRLGYVIRELETLSKDYDTCVICTSQFNRPVDKMRMMSPSLDRYRGSGEIEENTDIGILMHYPYQSATPEEREKIEKNNRSNIISVTVQKNRLHGLTGTFKVHFDKEWMKMYEIAEE